VCLTRPSVDPNLFFLHAAVIGVFPSPSQVSTFFSGFLSGPSRPRFPCCGPPRSFSSRPSRGNLFFFLAQPYPVILSVSRFFFYAGTATPPLFQCQGHPFRRRWFPRRIVIAPTDLRNFSPWECDRVMDSSLSFYQTSRSGSRPSDRTK